MLCRLKSCYRCGGDLILDEGDWRCWQCAHYYYPKNERLLNTARGGVFHTKAATGLDLSYDPWPDVTSSLDLHCGGEPNKQEQPVRRTRSARSINSVINAKKVSEERWWARNRQIIEYLDQGWSIREIARQTERGPRQIRGIRERLQDLRSENAPE